MPFASVRSWVALTAGSALFALAGCGGGGGSGGSPSPPSAPPTQTPASHGSPTPAPSATPTSTPHVTPTPTTSPTIAPSATPSPLVCPSGPTPSPAPSGQVVVTPSCVALNGSQPVDVTVSGGRGSYSIVNNTCKDIATIGPQPPSQTSVYAVQSDGFQIGACQAFFTDGTTSAQLSVLNNYVSH